MFYFVLLDFPGMGFVCLFPLLKLLAGLPFIFRDIDAGPEPTFSPPFSDAFDVRL